MKIEHFGREQIRILAVDDNPVALLLLEKLLGRHDGYVVRTAVDGREALQHLRSRPDATDIVLLDRMMPGIDGLAVCAAMKADERLRYIPVIMQTAADRPEEIVEGIRAGVFYYLTKPLDKDTLWKVGFGLVQTLCCMFRTIAEGESLATMLANFFPVPERALTGISELLVNAVEHGNLAIDYEAKGRLIRDNSWDDEIARRLADPRYSGRKVEVLFERRDDACCIRITDDGDGFDWQRYLEFDPARATDNHGRGIAMANMLCFDTLVFNERGNQVTGIVAR